LEFGTSSASHHRTSPVVGAAAAVSFKETRISLAEFKLTGKVKVWQTSYIQKYRDNYSEKNHELGSDQDVKSKMTVEEKHRDKDKITLELWKDIHRQNQMIGRVIEYCDAESELMKAWSHIKLNHLLQPKECSLSSVYLNTPQSTFYLQHLLPKPTSF
jgi:hypothetical protein